MTFHPISGLFSPGEGPALRHDVPDACAFERSGRWRTTRCRSTDVVAAVDDGSDRTEPLLCGLHAYAWANTPAALEGLHAVHPLDTLGEDGGVL